MRRRPVGWGILGVGRHTEDWMVPAISRAANARLAAICSRDRDRAEASAARHGAGSAHDSLADLLANPDVELVYIGSPNGVHAEQTLACAAAGKHVLCDKPMATTVSDCEEMIAACRKHGALLAVGYNQRYQAAHEVARDVIQSGELGDVVLVKAQCAAYQLGALPEWASDPGLAMAGSLTSVGIHVFDLVRWFLGGEVESVAGLTDSSSATKPIDELAVVSLRFDGGAFAQVDCSRRLAWPANQIEIHAERGFLRTSGTLSYETGGSLALLLRGSTRTYEFRPAAEGHNPYVAEVEHLSDLVRNGGEPRATGEDGLEGVRLISAIQQAAWTGRTVDLSSSREVRVPGDRPG